MSNARFAPHKRLFLRNGDRATSVTTALGELSKPALYRWNNTMGLKGIDTAKYVDEKAQAGTLAHAMILADLKGVQPDIKEFTGHAIDQAENSFLKYLGWKKDHVIEPILVEEPIIYDPVPFDDAEPAPSDEEEVPPYCGIIDLYCRLDGAMALVDFKTSKAVYPEHWFQVAAYRFLLLSGMHTVEQTRILQIGRDESEGFGDHARADLTNEFEIFLCALRIHHLKKNIKGGE
jgi:hypothetical protein